VDEPEEEEQEIVETLDEDEEEDESHIRLAIAATYGNRRFCDVAFAVGEEKKVFYASKVIIASRSPVFEAMLFSRFSEATSTGPIEISDIDSVSFEIMLHFMYADRSPPKVPLSADNVTNVLTCANKYSVEVLKVRCIELMSKNLTAETACSLFDNSPILLDDQSNSVLDYIAKHASKVIKTKSFELLEKNRLISILKCDALELDEIDVVQAVLRWTKAEVKREEQRIIDKALRDKREGRDTSDKDKDKDGKDKDGKDKDGKDKDGKDKDGKKKIRKNTAPRGDYG